MDALVAERVFGFERCTAERCPGPERCYAHPDTPDKGSVLARYSTTWEGLGLVVARMAERGCLLELLQADTLPGVWCAHFYGACGAPLRDGDWDDAPDFPTAPEAVARAALEALS